MESFKNIKYKLCNNFDFLDEMKSKYRIRINLIQKIFNNIELQLKENLTTDLVMELKLRKNHFLLELNRINENYELCLKNLDKEFYNEKINDFNLILKWYNNDILVHLNKIKNKTTNEILLFNLVKEINYPSITKFNIDKFNEIINLVCSILSNTYEIKYSSDK